jgi:hypothetical protein
MVLQWTIFSIVSILTRSQSAHSDTVNQSLGAATGEVSKVASEGLIRRWGLRF